MISNEQMEKLWWQYKNEGVAKNLSMQAFCSIHNVPYNAFEKYLKLRRHFSDVHHIKITDMPATDSADTGTTVDSESSNRNTVGSEGAPVSGSEKSVRIMINVRMTNGIQISRRDMDYRQLCSLVEKLEALC